LAAWLREALLSSAFQQTPRHKTTTKPHNNRSPRSTLQSRMERLGSSGPWTVVNVSCKWQPQLPTGCQLLAYYHRKNRHGRVESHARFHRVWPPCILPGSVSPETPASFEHGIRRSSPGERPVESSRTRARENRERHRAGRPNASDSWRLEPNWKLSQRKRGL
jgi:hypothetical protein